MSQDPRCKPTKLHPWKKWSDKPPKPNPAQDADDFVARVMAMKKGDKRDRHAD